MGLIVQIYRHADRDCTNSGISSRHDHLTITNIDGPFDPEPDRPAAKLVQGNIPGTCRIVPEEVPAGVHPMFGGNYAGTSDSRFSDEVIRLTGASFSIAPIHDRVER